MATIARLLKLIGPFGWWIVLGVLLSAATSVASVGLMAVSAYLISKAAVSTTLVDLSLLITGVRFFAISRAALRYAERYVNHKATFRILTRLRVWFYSAIEPLAPAALAAQHSGDLLARIVADIETLENFYLRVLIPPLSAVLVTAAACWILGLFDASWPGHSLAFVLLTGVVLPLLGRYLSRQAAQEVVGLRADLNVALLDEVQGMADVLAYGQERRQQARVETALAGTAQAPGAVGVDTRREQRPWYPLYRAWPALTVLALAIPLVHGGQIDGVFLALLPLTAIAAFEAIQPLAQSLQWLEVSQAAAKRIFALIDTPPAVRPLPPRQSARPSCGQRARPRARVWMHRPSQSTGLSFRYAGGEPWALDNLSLSIPAGSSLAIVGPNGSGKSTLANLFVRFWDYSGRLDPDRRHGTA